MNNPPEAISGGVRAWENALAAEECRATFIQDNGVLGGILLWLAVKRPNDVSAK